MPTPQEVQKAKEVMTAREILIELLGITIDNEHKIEMLEAKKEDIDQALADLRKMVMEAIKTKGHFKHGIAKDPECKEVSYRYEVDPETIADLFGGKSGCVATDCDDPNCECRG